MHLLLIRHGQSANNILEAAHGCGAAFNTLREHDPPLSSLGQLQAEKLGKHLGAQLQPSKKRVRLLCSSMTRACQTMEPLARALDLRPCVHPDLHEIPGFYLSNPDLPARGPGRKILEAKFEGYDASSIPEDGQGKETIERAAQRVVAVGELLNGWARTTEMEESIVVIVAHCDFLCLLTKHLLNPVASIPDSGHSVEDMFTDSFWAMNNTGINHIVLGVKPPVNAYPVNSYLLYFNRTDHLPEEMRAGVTFKNMGFYQAAEWARVGEGGSGLQPVFTERDVVHRPSESWTARVTWALVGAAVSVALLSLARR